MAICCCAARNATLEYVTNIACRYEHDLILHVQVRHTHPNARLHVLLAQQALSSRRTNVEMGTTASVAAEQIQMEAVQWYRISISIDCGTKMCRLERED